MAKIVASKIAPDEEFTVSVGAGLIKPGDTSDDRQLLIEAEAHPWLNVEYDKVEMLGGDVIPPAVDPKKDPLSIQNPDAQLPFDPEAVKADTKRVLEVEYLAPAAIDAGLDQDKSIMDGPVAKTLQAAEDQVEKSEASDNKTNRASKARKTDTERAE
jgi:hypothetical protein